MATEVPSDIVELIIAVDLNPTDPEEPINVSSVDVRGKGEGAPDGGEDWRGLCIQLLMGDPASGVTSDGISFSEATDAAARVLGEEEGPMDPFSMHKSRQEAPDAPKVASRPGGGGGGGLKANLNRILGTEKEDEEEED
jgi:hypothetical protein